MIQTLTYGELPEFERFKAAFNNYCPHSGVICIRGCRILNAIYEGGNVDLTLDQTWVVLQQASEGWKDNHELGDIANHILNSLGFEWV